MLSQQDNGALMIANENIIIFSSDDWESGLKSSKYHIALGLSNANKVLFINSIGLRHPSVSAKDMERIWRKLTSFFKGYQRINDNLFVFTPLVIPFHRIGMVRKINQLILVLSINVIQVLLKLKRPILLIFSPSFHVVVGHFREKETVYYCIDELKGYRQVDAVMFENMENSLMKEADCLVACSMKLVDKKKAYNRNTYYVPHGVEWALFRKALDGDLEIPEDVVRLKKPIIGYYGFISEDWIDFELLNSMAAEHPEWSLVLIGKTKVDLTTLLKHRNIYFLGVKPFEKLPCYNQAFDVAIIPFIINELTRSSNPLKLFEYLASGLPVISVNIPEVARYTEIVKVADNHLEFIKMTEQALKENSKEERYRRSDLVKNETWTNRIEMLSGIILKHCRSK